jgi:sucrose-6-phosphate hydrolase SacC (GH32 family)
MWYSAGEQNEPNAIGYATSRDGLHWTKCQANPILRPDPASRWEQDRVTACHVVRDRGRYIMFYIGFEDESYAQICIARSRDGVTDWERNPANPILRARTANRDAWDYDAVYKPYALWDGDRWLLWYNGRRGGVEQIGLAEHKDRELWTGGHAH